MGRNELKLQEQQLNFKGQSASEATMKALHLNEIRNTDRLS